MASTITVNFDSSDQNLFAHDAAEVLIDGSGATFKPLALTPDEMYTATAEVTANADRAIGSPITNYFRGTASWDSGNKRFNMQNPANGTYMSLNDDSGRDGINPLSPTAHFDFKDEGTIRAKVIMPYNGSPAANNYIVTTGDSTTLNGLGSLITLYHAPDGGLKMITRNGAGVASPTALFGAYVAVSNTKVEFELNIDSITGTAELYINGALLGSVSVSTVVLPRDFFYVGTYYLAPFSSELYIEDLQIFSEIQHTSNFTSEIPRTVGLYPSESRVIPAEFVTVEGISLLNHDAQTLNGSDIRYQMKIENSFYYYTTGVVASDGSYAQSSPLSNWIANIAALDDFVESGARVVMVPVLYSGADQTANPLLVSNTIDYDFFAVPVSCNLCTLYGFITDNCKPISSGNIRVWTKKPIPAQGNLVSVEETVEARLDVAGSEGFFEMPLIIPNYSSITSTTATPNGRNDLYQYEANWVDVDGKSWSKKGKLLVPNATSVLFNNAIVS